MGDHFLRTLTAVVQGTRSLEEFSSVLVSAAIEDTLLCVARDYGHEYSAMIEAYRDAITQRHANAGMTTGVCLGRNANGKACGRKAVCRGYCKIHVTQGEEEDLKRRKTAAYKNAVKAAPTIDAYPYAPASAYCVSKKDYSGFL